MTKIQRFLVPCLVITTIIYLIFSVHFFRTGLGGAMLLAVTLVPLAYIIYVLNSLITGKMLYPRLGLKANIIIATLYISACIFCLIYLRTEFENLIYFRVGFFNTLDKVVGAIMLGLVLEFSRKEHIILFYIIIFLVLYSVYGWIFPGIFGHPGVSWMRVITSSSVEVKLGLFGTYSQTGVAVIAAFFLLLSIAQGFGFQDSIIRTVVGIFGKRKSLIPQTAVVSSMAIASISGSGSANVAITGQYTIPLMKRTGFPPLYAGAVEASASLGGLIMPPVMAIAAFLMADFLGVSYFEVIARGYAPALVFYAIIAVSVYLFALRFVRDRESSSEPTITVTEKFTRIDVVNTVVFFSFLGILIYLLGGLRQEESTAALNTAIGLFLTASVLRIYSYPGTILNKIKEWGRSVHRALLAFAEVTAPIVLLLAMLGVMINLFVVSGWMLKLLGLLMQVAEFHLLAIIGMGFLIGVLLGLGIPPSACYILGAVIVIPAMVQFGINPWVAHFFIFLVAVISEYSPPTSLVAAVASRLSGAAYMATMLLTLRISLTVFLLTFCIFNWDTLVLQPGLAQLAAIGTVTIGCLAVAVAIHGRLFKRKIQDLPLRFLALLLGLFILFYPKSIISILALLPASAMIVFTLYRSPKIWVSPVT